MGIKDVSGLWSFLYSITFQIRQIPTTNHHFSSEKAYSCVGQDFWKKKKHLFWFAILLPQASKLFCHWKNTSKPWRIWSLALPVHNILSHLHLFKAGKIMLRYGNLMLPPGHILDLYCVWLSFTFACSRMLFCIKSWS